MTKKVALVTNVTELAGVATALALQRAGMAVVCHDERFGDSKARTDFENRHGGIETSAEQEPPALVALIIAAHGSIDALFSNDVLDF